MRLGERRGIGDGRPLHSALWVGLRSAAAAIVGLALAWILSGPSPVSQATTTSPHTAVLYSDDFEDGEATGWEVPGSWEVISNGSGKVLRGGGSSQAVASNRQCAGGDYTLGVRVRLEQGGTHLICRAGGGYRYFIGFAEGSLTLNRSDPNGVHTNLASKTGSWKTKRWYEVAIALVGGAITISVDGAMRISYTDPAPILYGWIELEVGEEARVLFDDIRVMGQLPPTTGLHWVRTGGPLGGIGYDIRMRPGNPDTLYVTDAWSGVNVSSDGGQTWSPSNAGITSRAGLSGDGIPIFCLAIDPRDPDTVWAGTLNTRGIWKSTDAGKTWAQKQKGIVEEQGISFRGLTVDPRDSDTVYAAAELQSIAWTPDGTRRMGREFDLTKGVVYKTTDGGETWAAVWRGDNLARYVLLDPGNPDTLYVSTGIFDAEAANSDPQKALAGGVGVLKSEDGGGTWRVLGTSNGLRNLYVGSLFLHPEKPEVLLAGTGNRTYSDNAGVYLSEDGGKHWRQVLETPGEACTAVEFAVSEPGVAYAGTGAAIYRSTDAGRTWVLRASPWGPPGIRPGFPIDIQVDPRDADRVFVNNYGGGNFLSEDGGLSWRDASRGYTGAQVTDIAVASADSNLVYALARIGPFVSQDGGKAWEPLCTPPLEGAEWGAVALSPAGDDTVLIADGHCGFLYLSHDAAQSFGTSYHHPAPVTGDSVKQFGFAAVAFAPSTPGTIYAGMRWAAFEGRRGERSYGVYTSADGGRTWRAANDLNTADLNINAIAVDPEDASVAYIGTFESGILKSGDGGASWVPVNAGLASRDARALALDAQNPQLVYAGLENGGLWKSTDAGAHWQRIGAGIDPQASIRDIVIDPTDSQTLYAADVRTGVYRSTDAGTTWFKMNDGLSTRAVLALAISADGRILFAATQGEGVFRLDLQTADGG